MSHPNYQLKWAFDGAIANFSSPNQPSTPKSQGFSTTFPRATTIQANVTGT
jgi:hypothetical protein